MKLLNNPQGSSPDLSLVRTMGGDVIVERRHWQSPILVNDLIQHALKPCRRISVSERHALEYKHPVLRYKPEILLIKHPYRDIVKSPFQINKAC